MRTASLILLALNCVLFDCLAAHEAHSQSVEDFYRGKTLTLIVSAGVGGGYDNYARAFATHFGRHVPGSPAVVVQNMTGAGGLRAALFLYNVAPRDGSMIALVQSTSVLSPLIGTTDIALDPLRFSWLGNISREYSLCASWHESKIRSVQDLLEKGFVVGSSGAGTAMELYPHVLNKLLGTHIRIISGYNGGTPVLIAMERGEVDGRCGASLATYQAVRPDWIRDHKINMLLQTSLEKDPELPDVPWVVDYVKGEEQKAVLELTMAPRLIQRPIIAPPDLPRDRFLALQNALEATVQDPKFLEEARMRKLDISLMRAGDLVATLERLSKFPKTIRAQVAELLNKRN